MTTLVEDINTLLATLAPAGGVSYAINEAQQPVYPYIVWTRIASTPNVSLTGVSAMQNTHIQIDILSRTIATGVALETALESLFAAASIMNVPISSLDHYEDSVRAFRIIKDYSVWATN